jgi:ribonuclease P protein component
LLSERLKALIGGEVDQTPFKLVTLRRRAEFQRVRGGGRSASPRFVLEGKLRASLDQAGQVGPRFGFTVTKQMGNAVVRNRIKRRLRAALAEVAGQHAAAGFDYVIIARTDAHGCDYQLLIDDFAAGFARVHRGPPAQKPRTAKPEKPKAPKPT